MDRSNRDKLVLDLTEAIIRLTDNDTRKFMSCAARQKGLELTWSSKGKKIYRLIEDMMMKKGVNYEEIKRVQGFEEN